MALHSGWVATALARLAGAFPLAACPLARVFCETLSQEAYEVALVGGFVRDLLVGKKPRDLDLVTNAPMAAVAQLAREQGYKVLILPRAAQHQTTLLVGPSGSIRIDVASLAATSELWPRVLSADLMRRDLTINAMALRLGRGPLRDRFLDPSGGLADLDVEMLRPVGTRRKRFTEDPLRMLRMARFYAQERRWQLAPRADEDVIVCAHLLTRVSANRIWDELAKGLAEGQKERFGAVLCRLGLLTPLFWPDASAAAQKALLQVRAVPPSNTSHHRGGLVTLTLLVAAVWRIRQLTIRAPANFGLAAHAFAVSALQRLAAPRQIRRQVAAAMSRLPAPDEIATKEASATWLASVPPSAWPVVRGVLAAWAEEPGRMDPRLTAFWAWVQRWEADYSRYAARPLAEEDAKHLMHQLPQGPRRQALRVQRLAHIFLQRDSGGE